MPWNWKGALQGGLAGLVRAGGYNAPFPPWPQPQGPQISPEGQLLTEWVRGGVIKPERAAYWLSKQKEGMSSADILKNLTEQDFASKKTADQAKREAEGMITQRMGEVLAGQTQRRAGQQAGAFNQMLQQGQPPQQQLPIGGQAFDPNLRVQPEGLVPLQQQNLIELLRKGGEAGASLSDILATQKLFPQTLTAPKAPEQPKPMTEYQKGSLGLRKRALDLSEQRFKEIESRAKYAPIELNKEINKTRGFITEERRREADKIESELVSIKSLTSKSPELKELYKYEIEYYEKKLKGIHDYWDKEEKEQIKRLREVYSKTHQQWGAPKKLIDLMQPQESSLTPLSEYNW